MRTKLTLAVTGDSIINRRLSVHTEGRFLSLVKILRGADVAYTQLETLIHDYDGPEIYPAADGGTRMRSPRFVADELRWAGFRLVSTASNHSLDYSYGGLMSTWKALDEAGLVHAGTGMNLGEAREPAYLDAAGGRVALISMVSSCYPGWARAGEARRDVKGRPGLNVLRYHHVADLDTIEKARRLAIELGWCVAKAGKAWLFNPPGLQMAICRFVEGDGPGVSMTADEGDAEGNLQSIREAARQADYVLAHLHNHEFDPKKGEDFPPDFVPPFARGCIDAGAHVFIAQGSLSPLRGIEIYKGRPIFYDPGVFMGMSNTVTRLPSDFYSRPGYSPAVRSWKATPADAFDAREELPEKLNPPPGRLPSRVKGSVLALCSLGEDGKLTELKLHPVTLVRKPRPGIGLPLLADGETARMIVAFVGELSAPFGTRIGFRDGSGFVQL